MNSLKVWRKIISSPFKGFSEVGDETRIALPLMVLLILFLFSVLLLAPVMQSEAYSNALVRVQITSMEEKGQAMSKEQQTLMTDSLKSPAMRKITIASALGGGLVTYFAIMLLTALLILIITRLMKEKVKYGLIFKILVFAGIISIIQSLIKNTITLTGNWERLLNQTYNTEGLKYALQSSVSLASLFSPDTVGKTGYFLLDTFTDIFNWLYYIYIYAGLKTAAGLNKNKALYVTIISAGVFVIIGLLFAVLL